MKIEKRIYVESDMIKRTLNKGSVKPTWLNNHKDVSSWYNASNNPPDYAFFYNVLDDEFYIQYGKNQPGWASARFFGQKLQVLKEVEKLDGSIDVTVRTQPLFFKGHKNDIAIAGFRTDIKLVLNNKTIYHFKGNTIESFSYPKGEVQEFTVNVKPEETSSKTAFIMQVHYPDGQFNDRNMKIGIGLYNPNPPSYTPLSIRKGGTWKSLNKNNGFIKIRKNGAYIDKSKENTGTMKQENKGHNRIRKSNKWLQLPPME